MEFSELFELDRLSKNSYKSHLSPLQTILNSPSKPPRYSHDIFRVQISNSPSPDPFPSTSAKTPKFQIEKDVSYLNPKHEKPLSSLTLSLQQPEEPTKKSQNIQLLLKVYFFNSFQNLELVLPYEIKVVDMIVKALISYKKHFKANLPYGLDPNAYQAWLPCEDTYSPDFDFMIPKDLSVVSIGSKSICICEKPGFSSFRTYPDSRAVLIMSKKAKTILKVHFKNAWTHIPVKLDTKLQDLLPALQKKFFIQGWVSSKNYEFKVFIDEIGEYCIVDMDLLVKDLRTAEVELFAKRYIDNP